MKFISTLAVVPYLALQVASSPVASSGFESDEVMEAQFQKANHHPTTEHALKRRDHYDGSSYALSHKRNPRAGGVISRVVLPAVIKFLSGLFGVSNDDDKKDVSTRDFKALNNGHKKAPRSHQITGSNPYFNSQGPVSYRGNYDDDYFKE
ncbi:hypothetical protein DSO57_1005083 [Entomophthora muscae]|uniref:Uncharacterized protein n=1 Tax=Entomophthora muscae TaxID=34485 RepID=A0ACC2RMP9_9FUNG|nr:hypothetical protein DSO57_1005083 [Entomophthora muscae]